MAELGAKYVIIGGGLAAASAVEGIREVDNAGSIIMVAREEIVPYHRPPLTKDYLRGETALPDIYVHDADFYKENHVQLFTSREAVAIDTAAKLVRLDKGDVVSYAKLLLATGSTARSLDAPGGDLPAVHYIRRLEDSEAVRQLISEGQEAVVIGSGFIGVEASASLTQRGVKVTLLNKGAQVWQQFGPAVATFITKKLTAEGVNVVNNASAAKIEQAGSRLRVTTEQGQTFEADFIIAGVGAAPHTALAEAAGLTMAERGVSANAKLLSSAPDVYVAGDIAAFDSLHYNKKLRIEHWDVAANSGKQAGRNMAGANEDYTVLPYFFSDVFDIGMEYLGNVKDSDETIVRGDPAQSSFTVLYISSDSIAAALFINNNPEVEPIKQLITDKASVKAHREQLTSGSLLP